MNNSNLERMRGMVFIKKVYLPIFFLVCFIVVNSFHFTACAEPSGDCIESEEICGNGIDEDCSGADTLCKDCSQNVIPVSGCNCGGKTEYSGFCCGGFRQATPCDGKVYCVDVNGDDSYDGSEFKPWKSLRNAVSKLKPGDTILVNPGHYVEKKQISIKISGEENKPIIIRGNGEEAFIDLSECSARNCFEIDFANYIRIENLTVCASKDKNSRGIRLTHSKGSIVRNNKVYGARHANIFSSLSNNNLFENNEAYNGKIGIYVSNSSDFATIRNNILHNNSVLGLHMNADLRSSEGEDGIISHALVENNIIYDNTTGINLDGVTESIFRNNLLYNNKKRGIAFFKENGAVPSNDNLVIHNTIVMPAGAFYAIGLNYGAYRNTFYNNIILTAGNVPCFSTTGKIGDLEVLSDYNLVPKNGKIWELAEDAYRFGKWQKKLSEIAHKTANFVTGQSSGNDRHSVQAEIGQMFADNTKGDFQLKLASPAIDKGISTYSFGKDLIGNRRPIGCCPDIGAYEYYGGQSYKIASNKGEAPEVKSGTLSSKATNINATGKIESFKKKTLKNKLGMEFTFIPPGSFRMGIDPSSKEGGGEAGLHQVIFEKGFYVQINEVNQKQWQELMGTNPSFFKDCGDDCPVERVSWNDVQEFIKRLNDFEKTDKYRLPTEAEWEYSCRAGTQSPFSFGGCLSTSQANYCGNFPFDGCEKGLYREKPVSVDSFPPNAWGLIGMHGNVWEWCQDWFSELSPGSVVDPLGPASGSFRVIRGGGWNSYAKACSSGNRSVAEPAKYFANLGFRVVKDY